MSNWTTVFANPKPYRGNANERTLGSNHSRSGFRFRFSAPPRFRDKFRRMIFVSFVFFLVKHPPR